jgi:hypothetical protein
VERFSRSGRAVHGGGRLRRSGRRRDLHTIAPAHHEILLRVCGDRFLGYDNGEQDGRYIGSYADRGAATNRKEGWDDFVQWDEHVCGDSMNVEGDGI